MPHQWNKPSGWIGRLLLRNMNTRHSGVTDWGLSHVKIGARDIVLDAGCGGGRTVAKLAAAAAEGKIYGVDHSEASLAVATKNNESQIAAGHVEIRSSSVSELPFSRFDFRLGYRGGDAFLLAQLAWRCARSGARAQARRHVRHHL